VQGAAPEHWCSGGRARGDPEVPAPGREGQEHQGDARLAFFLCFGVLLPPFPPAHGAPERWASQQNGSAGPRAKGGRGRVGSALAPSAPAPPDSAWARNCGGRGEKSAPNLPLFSLQPGRDAPAPEPAVRLPAQPRWTLGAEPAPGSLAGGAARFYHALQKSLGRGSRHRDRPQRPGTGQRSQLGRRRARHGMARHGMARHGTAWHSVAFLGPVTALEAGRGCSRCLPASSTQNAAVSCPAPASLPPLPWLTSVLELGCSRTGKSFSLTSSERLSPSLLWAEPGFLLGPGRGTLPGRCWGDGGSSAPLPWGPSASIHSVPSSPSCAS